MVDPDITNPRGSFFQASIEEAGVLKKLKPQIEVRATNIDEAESIILHEVQHSIQAIEGFARGWKSNYRHF